MPYNWDNGTDCCSGPYFPHCRGPNIDLINVFYLSRRHYGNLHEGEEGEGFLVGGSYDFIGPL